MKTFLKSISNIHYDKGDNVMIFSTPRSGSTWLMELIKTQPGFKVCNEPLNIRNANIARALGTRKWTNLYSENFTETQKNYFQEILSNRHLFLNGSPIRKYYRPISSRIVFKVINAGELIVNDIAEASKSKLVYLIRHPITVSLSRKQLPRLDALTDVSILKEFNSDEINTIEKYKYDDNHVIKAVLSWCIQNKLALNRANKNWIIFTYEQLVVNPDPIIKLISEKLDFKKSERIYSNLKTPSAVTVQSNPGTMDLIKQANEYDIINKWRKHVDGKTVDTIQRILKTFDLDIYDAETSMPKKYVIE
jgi:hypothetical protein